MLVERTVPWCLVDRAFGAQDSSSAGADAPLCPYATNARTPFGGQRVGRRVIA